MASGGPCPLLVFRVVPILHPNWFPSFLVTGVGAAFLPWEADRHPLGQGGDAPLTPTPALLPSTQPSGGGGR